MSPSWAQNLGRVGVGDSPSNFANKGVRDAPFHILLLGDFSGASQKRSQFSARKPIRVDRDNIDDAIRKLEVMVRLDLGSANCLDIPIGSMEHFHPDQLYSNLEVFSEFRRVRNLLSDPMTFTRGMEELKKWKAVEPTSQPSQPVAREETKSLPYQESAQEILEQLLGSSPSPSPERVEGSETWGQFLHQLVGPYLLPDIEDEQEEMIGCLDQAISDLMRQILHAPQFQALESAWRSIQILVQRLETGENLQIFILDCTRMELEEDLLAYPQKKSSLHDLMVTQTVQTPGAIPWAVAVGNFTWARKKEDIACLSQLADLASASGSPFLSSVSPDFYGCRQLPAFADPDDWESMANHPATPVWDGLRKKSEAAYLGLCSPRFLLRLPYGKKTSQIDNFEFEEMKPNPANTDFLWGNGAVACALLLGEDFEKAGWGLSPGDHLVVENLPLFTHSVDDETCCQPVAEALLTDRAAMIMLEEGIMPWLTLKNRGTMRLARLQSITNPPTSLSGPWSSKVS